MELPIYQVDAFASEIFKGNPAAVVPLDFWLSDDILQKIAIENNLSETAFFIPDGDNFYLRWFTPSYEVDLCGHATLATAYVILEQLFPDRKQVTFNTNVAGQLVIHKTESGLKMDLPIREGQPVSLSDIPDFVIIGLGGKMPIEAFKARDLMLVYQNEQDIQDIKADFNALLTYPHWIGVTAKSNDPDIDFVSRFFCADDSIGEDPVTGSSHCTLAPYWAKKLNKTQMKAKQISARGGDLNLELIGNRVHISGNASLYLKGVIYV